MIGTIMLIGILLLAAGFVLIGVELVIPGFGIPGVCGIACLLAGIFLTADSLESGILLTVIVIVILGVLMTVMMGLMTRKNKPPIVLETDLKSGAMIDASDLSYLLGKEGVAATDLKPAGKGDFDGIVLDIFSEGRYVEKGCKIVISRVEKNKLIVRQT